MRLRQAGALTPADVIRLISSPQRPNVYENAAELMRERSLLSELGGDPKAYRERILNEALADPDFQARAIEAARAQAGGPAQAQIARPLVRLPSVNRSGSGAGSPPLRQDESDDQLIAWATNRKSPRPE